MSRVGLKPISVPAGATVEVHPGRLDVKGPKGELSCPIPDGIELSFSDGVLTAKRGGDEQAALHGLTRSLAQNAVTGVTTGFAKNLEIVGIGYRAQVAGRVVVFNLG